MRYCYDAILQVLKERDKEVSQTKKVDVQDVFKVLDSSHYYRLVPPVSMLSDALQ
jgi:hypothetical protein